MGIWNPTVFLDENLNALSPCTSWNYVDNFDQDWQDTNFWWKRRFSLALYNTMWNNGAAIRLLIDKCNDLQAQIDAGSGGVDMAAILNAMWNSIGGQTMDFILYIDSMRGSISERAVFEPYLTSYMRHFLNQ
jgi:hypothetical protein